MSGDTTIQIELCLERLQAGDKEARDALITVACHRLEHLARRMLRRDGRLADYQETGDVLQEASLRLWKRLEQVKPVDARDFFRLAAQHVRWVLIDLARRIYGPTGNGAHEVPVSQVNDEGNGNWAPPANESSYDPLRLALWTELHEQVERMPVKEREIVDLLFYQGLTQVEAAKIAGMSERTVREHWVRARRNLRRLLREEV